MLLTVIVALTHNHGTNAATGSHPKRAKISDFLALAAGGSRSCSVHIKLLLMCYKNAAGS